MSFFQVQNFSPVQLTGFIILGLLIVASILIYGLSFLKNHPFVELKQRINSWWVMAGFFLIAVFIEPKFSIILFACASFLSLKEYSTLIHTKIEDHRILLWSYIAIPLQYFWIYQGWQEMFLIFIPVYIFLFNPFRRILTGQYSGIVESMGKIQWGLMAFVFCLSHAAAFLFLPVNESIPFGGQALFVYLVLLTELNDISQFIFGKLFGKIKIVPNISPNKTLAGLMGGVFCTVIFAILFQFLTGFSLYFAIFSGLLIGLSGFIGDVTLSALKRDVGVKDSSNLIPGHGGILDRIDSLVYTAPLFFHFVNYFFY